MRPLMAPLAALAAAAPACAFVLPARLPGHSRCLVRTLAQQTRMQAAAAAPENNIIPLGGEDAAGAEAKMEVLARPPPPPDRVVPHQSFQQAAKEAAALSMLPQEFVDAVCGADSAATLGEEALRQRIMVAKTFARMASLIILMRGENVLAPDFTFYSPSTGTLGKDEYLGLLRTQDRAFPGLASFPVSFTAYGDGVVTFRTSYRATFEGALHIGGAVVPPTGVTAVTDVELCAVTFTDVGLLRRLACGVVVDSADQYKDPAVLERIEALQNKADTNRIKIEQLAGQEHTIAYQKSAEEIASIDTELVFLREQVDVASNTGGLGGLEGLFHAAGVEWPSDVQSLIGLPPHKHVEGGIEGGITVPSEAPLLQSIVYK